MARGSGQAVNRRRQNTKNAPDVAPGRYDFDADQKIGSAALTENLAQHLFQIGLGALRAARRRGAARVSIDLKRLLDFVDGLLDRGLIQPARRRIRGLQRVAAAAAGILSAAKSATARRRASRAARHAAATGQFTQNLAEDFTQTAARSLSLTAARARLTTCDHLTENIAKAATKPAAAAALALLAAAEHLTENITEAAAASAAALTLLTTRDHLAKNVAEAATKAAAGAAARVRPAAQKLLKHLAQQAAHAAIAHGFVEPTKKHRRKNRQ